MRNSILICDDEEGVREAFKLILEKDYDLILAENGDDAVRKMKAKPTDLAILDIKMPRMDGLATLKALKKTHPALKVIIATGYKSMETIEAASKLGVSDYLIKPFDRKHVLATVAKLFQ